MSVPKHRLPNAWYRRRLIVHQLWYQPIFVYFTK